MAAIQEPFSFGQDKCLSFYVSSRVSHVKI